MFFFNWCIIYSSVVKHLELNQYIIYIALKFNLICIIIQFGQILKEEIKNVYSLKYSSIFNLEFSVNNSISEYSYLLKGTGKYDIYYKGFMRRLSSLKIVIFLKV